MAPRASLAPEPARAYVASTMELFFNILIPVALFAVVVPLIWGFVAMAIGGDYNKRHANKLMAWRVKLQAVAVVILAIAFWYKSTH